MAASSSSGNTTFAVTVHEYLPTSTSQRPSHAYEYSSSSASNALVFIGGLGDGPHDVPYIRTIAASVSSLSYSVFEVRLSSAKSGWGYSSLEQDVDELTAFVRYLRQTLRKENVVLMGHSTGSQDCMEYLLRRKEEGVDVDGVILQGPVSDREAIGMEASSKDIETSVEWARKMISEGRKDEIMPGDKFLNVFGHGPVTAYRWFSLAAKGGDDDYFSSDLSDEELARIWGRLDRGGARVLIVLSAEDEHVPKSVDIGKVVERWKEAGGSAVSELSGFIPGANHRVEKPEAQEWLANRVARFLESLD
ncbi:dolichol-phosphate mannosyltransferase [Apodospora peruviana]|uniref:Dolichol-phosphate mannosyltransferase n=1 Tax=Apodospora peruviana TaxID=516989 RepID=A0AAE0IBV9_9PEZI|nr:dolichol-phosphate mannosyltransferase [Apodospora peruviana]